jgi:flagellar biosynthesis protein FlhG
VRSLLDQDHYEVLEIDRRAAPEDVERAYHVVRSTFDSESLALYSVFGERDAAVIRERIDEAYRVLSDEAARRAYDAADGAGIGAGASDVEPARDRAATGRPSSAEGAVRESSGRGADLDRLSGASDSFRDLEADIEEGAGDEGGALLRRARLRRGFDLEQIADITKVSIANLRNLEEESFDDLPATVYVRGFVTAYARTIGLDPGRVVSSYLARVEEARNAHGRTRFLGRR